MDTPVGQSENGGVPLTRSALRTPRAAAIAGIVFAVLFTLSIGLMRLAIPESIIAADASEWLQNSTRTVQFALTLVPFAGIAFLWFMGVVRSHLGQHEDQFFATIFFGSGLLFLAMIFSSAALAGGIVGGYAIAPELMTESGVIIFGRSVIYTITNVYAIRMAGVFMLSLGTLWARTRAMPRLFVILTYLLALTLLLAINLSLWAIMVFPAWVFVISVFILVRNLRSHTAEAEGVVGAGD